MKILRKIFKHKFILGTFVMALSAVILAATLIPVFSVNLNTDNKQVNTSDTSPETPEEPIEPEEVIKPYHEYTSLTVSLNTGAMIYAGVTTANDLKSNLKVKGTFRSGNTDVLVDLRQNEYTLQVSIDSFTQDLKGTDIVLNTMPTESQAVHVKVKVINPTGEVLADTVIPLSSVAEATDYEKFKTITGITVENVSSITNDYDKESLKEILVVKDSAGKAIENKELYEVTSLDKLTPGSGASFTVTYKYGNLTTTGTISSVTQAELLAADFSVNSEYRLNGMYYQREVVDSKDGTKGWYSAFVTQANGTAGSTMQDIYGDGLKITVHYPHSSRMLTLPSVGENSATAETNEYIVFNNTTFQGENNDITAQIFNYIGGKSVTASISINFELAKIVEIKAEGYNTSLNLSSSDVASEYFFENPNGGTYIFTKANTGVWNEETLSLDEIKVSGTLNPTAEIMKDIINKTDEELKSYTYKKAIIINFENKVGEKITTTYEVEVHYKPIISVSRLKTTGNKFPIQTMRMPFNFGDLIVEIIYNEEESGVEIPLTDFVDIDGKSNHVKIILYNDPAAADANKIGEYIGETPKITKDVKAIRIYFRYDTKTENWSTALLGKVPNLSIQKYVVALPSFDTRTISFSSNAIKTMMFDDSIPQDILDGLTLNVFKDNLYEEQMEESAYSITESVTGKGKEIKFLVGGKEYYIELKIPEKLAEEVTWASGTGVNGTSVRYVVDVTKGPLNPVVVSYTNGTWIYGDTPEVPTIVGTRVDGSTLNILYGNQESDITSNNLYAEYTIRYYKTTDPTKEVTGKLEVGEYYVQIYIKETTNYLEAYSTPGPGYGCPIIEITPAPLSPDALLPNITKFDGVAREGNAFVTAEKATGIKYDDDKNVVATSDLTSKTTGISLTSDEKALHAGQYSLKLSITNSNYVWADGVEADTNGKVTKDFEIYKRNLGYDITNESSLGFTYSEAEALPTVNFGYNDNFNADAPSYNSSKPTYFFAVEGDIKYYNSAKEEVNVADFKKWPAGTYTVKRTLKEDTTLGHLASDYTLPTAEATFVIEKKTITRIADASASNTYNRSTWTYTINNWNAGSDNSGAPILTGVLTGKPFKEDGTLDEDSTIELANFGASAANGKIQILHAGVYTYTITLNSNYKWGPAIVGEGETAPSDQPVITLTMNQKVLKGSLETAVDGDDFIWDSNVFNYNPEATTGQQTPTITMIGIAQQDGMNLSYTLHYSDGTEVTDANKKDMTAADYYYLLTGWTCQESDGYNTANNYRFPDDRKIITFTVASAALKNITFKDSLTGVYKGENFDFREFISNLDEFTYGTNNEYSKVLYYVVSGSSNDENANKLDKEMLPLFMDTGSYTIYIYPNANFDWEDKSLTEFGGTAPTNIQSKKGFKATFTITPKVILRTDIDWGANFFNYIGEKQTPTPTIKPSALLNDVDKTDVKLKPVQIQTGGSSDGTNAGSYTAKLNGFAETSTRAFNYILKELFTCNVTIYKCELDIPTMSVKTGTYTGSNQTLAVTLPKAPTVTGYDTSTLINGTVKGGWDAIGTTAHSGSYSNGEFTCLNAGKYQITFTLTDTTNYKWKNDAAEVVINDIVISPYKLDAPTMSVKTGAFTGSVETLTVTLPEASTVTGYNKNTLINGTVLGGWDAIGTEAHSASYTNGQFNYLNAGKYQITFTLKDNNNYKWKNNETEIVIDGIEIKRMEIIAPVLGDLRTVEYNASNSQYPWNDNSSNWNVTINNTQFTITHPDDSSNNYVIDVNNHQIQFSVLYGAYSGSFDYITSSIDPKEYGKYYIQFNIVDATNYSHLNYVWKENTTDTSKRDFLTQNEYSWGKVSQENEQGTALFLAFMITRKLFQPKLEALNDGEYIFGDNGEISKYTQGNDFSDINSFIHFADSDRGDAAEVIKLIDSEKPIVSYHIYSLTSLGDISTDFEKGDNALEDLVNGLPWNKGYYGIYVFIDFTNGGTKESQFENIPIKLAFEVKPRDIVVEWAKVKTEVSKNEDGSSAWTMEYDGITYKELDQLVTARITNLAKKNSTDEPIAPELTISSNKTVRNVNTYTFTVEIRGTEPNDLNYNVLTSEESVSTTFKITPVTLSLAGKTDVASFEYGVIPTLNDSWWDYQVGSAKICSSDTAADVITYEIVNTNENKKFTVGTYDIKIKIVKSNVNYVLSSDTTNGSLNITEREITLVLDSSDEKTTSVYQEAAITLGTPYTVNHGTSENVNNWLVEGDRINDIFTLALYKDETDVTENKFNPVGTYDIKVIKGTDANYKVYVQGNVLSTENPSAKLGDYTITPATLTVESIIGNEVTYDTQAYNWIKDSTDQERKSLIVYTGLNGVNLENNNVRWTITKKDTTDTVSGTATNAFASTIYVVTVSADNHTTTDGVEVTVEIKKAQLTISVNFTGEKALYYGEELPTITNLEATNFTVDGLKGEDSRTVIGGTFSYTSTYSLWDAVGNDYTTTMDVSSLTADNYTFQAEGGSIEVKALPIDIKILNLENVYIQDISKKEESDVLLVSNFQDLYEKLQVSIATSVGNRVNQYLQTGKNIDDIVTLITEALKYDASGNITATNDVAKYPLYLVAAEGEDSLFSNYTISISIDENTLDTPEGALDNKTAAFTITQADNKFTDYFGFEGIGSLTDTDTEETIVKAWVYGINGGTVTDGYDKETHQIKLPTTKLNSVPGQTTTNNSIVYTLYYWKDSAWVSLGESTDIATLFANCLKAGKFVATKYKVEYTLKGNDNYSDATDTRYFKVNPRDLYVWAKDATTYYGEDFVRSVEASGLVDNGCGTVDTLAEVLTITYEFTYSVGSDAKTYSYTVNKENELEKYSNYILHQNATVELSEKKGTITVSPRPVIIEIDEKTNKYDFNKASGVTEDKDTTLTFTATLGENALNITFANPNPFIGLAPTTYNNGNQDIVKLYTNALLTGDVETQNVGNYAIYAAYADDTAKNNYAITVKTVYSRDTTLEAAVDDYFSTTDSSYAFYETYIKAYYDELALSNKMISVLNEGEYLAGTYHIISANLRLTVSSPEAGYDGTGKAVTIEGYGQDDPYGKISYKAQYDYGNNDFKDAAPINVGSYPVRIVVDNPNYFFDAGSQGTKVVITERILDWTADINEEGQYAESNAYGNSTTIYKGVDNRNKLELKFKNVVTNTGVVEGDGKDAKLNFTITVNGKAIDASAMSLADAYSSSFVSHAYALDTAVYELTAQHSGVYTVNLTLSGSEAANYKFPETYLKAGTTDTYEFTFTIQRASKTGIRAQDSTVQYGTPITTNGTTTNEALFGGFKLDANTLALIAAENSQLSGSADPSKVTYSVPNYDSRSTSANTNCYILPAGLVLYNYKVQYSEIGVLAVKQREIVVVVKGSEANNKFASVVYTGELQAPDLTSVEASKAYFVPKDLDGGIKWYGDAEEDNLKNFATLFNASLDLYGDGSFGVSAGKGLNANTYYINIHRGNISTNYDVTFQNNSGNQLDEYPTTDKDIAPQFKITKKDLIVQAGSTGLNNTDTFVTNFTIPYGNLLQKEENTYYYLTSEFDGLVDRDNTEEFINATNARLSYTTIKASGNGEASYVPWDSHAGSIYTVAPDPIEFENYQVTNWNTASMEVVSRLVTASTENRTYTEYINNGVINYYQGAQGTYHAAQVVFNDYDSSLYNTNGFEKYYTNGKVEKDEFGVIKEGIKTAYTPKYNPSYVNKDNRDEVVPTDGPRMAGSYKVTITVQADSGHYDYKIVTNTTEDIKTELSFDVYKKKLSINWNSVSSDYLNFNTGDEKYRDVENYINAIMVVDGIERQYSNSNSEQVVESIFEALNSNELSHRYYINELENKVTINIYGVGLYTARIRITNSAIRNYEWRDSSGANGAVFTLAFRVAASSVTIDGLEFEVGSWVYGELAPEITFNTNVQGVGLLYKYAKIDAIPDNFTAPTLGELISDRDLTDYLNKNNHGYSQTMPTDAGTYVMCAWYPGSDQYQMSEAFLVFEITKAPIKSPDLINSEVEFIEEDGKKVIEMVYTGNTLYLELGYDTKLLDISYAGNMSAPSAGKGMILHATDVVEGGYSISFALSDQSNYTWENESVGEYIWRVVPAADNEITSFDVSELVAGLTYGDSYVNPSASAKYSQDTIIEYYVDGVWGTTKPTKAGNYKVRAVSPATKNYYAGTADTQAVSEEIEFSIDKADLYVSASGSMTYGDAFSTNGGTNYRYQFAGFLNNDSASIVTVDGIEYTLVNEPAKLEVGTYGIQLVEAYGEVLGMTADNYKILATEGTFTVQKKNVTVVLGDAQSTYGEKIDLSKVSMLVVNNDLVEGDTLEDLNIVLSIDSLKADMESRFNPATSYKVNAEGYTSSKNYNVMVFGSGVYTIQPLNIYITVEAGGGIYQGNITPATITGIYAVEDDKNILEEFDASVAPRIRFNYWGNSNDGNWSHSNADMWDVPPTLAGNYHATAVSTQTNNYNLVTNRGTPSVTFVIERKTLDDTNREVLFTESMEYTGKPITPVVTDHGFEGLYQTKQVSFENVGVYSVPLTLKDSHNYKWSSVDGDTCEIPFEIIRGYNAFENEVEILDWVYGAYDAKKNLPNAEIRFGSSSDFTYSYATSIDGTYTPNVPTQAGTYWVKISAPQTDNYYAVTSDAKEFHITKAIVKAPSVVIENEGENQNTIYTGSRLQAAISGYDPSTMRMIYDGDSSVGNTVAIFGLDAKTYVVSFALNDSANYTWAEDTAIEDGNAVLQWKVGRKQLAKPTMNTNMFMVNGGTLTFIPVGFDEETMAIEGNKTSYGGSFKVTVTIKDTQNFEWTDGTINEVVFDWFVVGWDTVFIIVVSVLGVIAAIAGIAIVIQYVLHKRKKKKELEDELAVQGLIADEVNPAGESVEEPTPEEPKNLEDGGKENE